MRTALSWVLFWIGHFVSVPMERFDWGFLYPTYNWLMGKSFDLDKHERVWNRDTTSEKEVGDV